MLEAIQKNPPPSTKGKYIKIKYVTQLPTHSPTFAFSVIYHSTLKILTKDILRIN